MKMTYFATVMIFLLTAFRMGLFALIIFSLIRFLRSQKGRKEKTTVQKEGLAESLKEHRMDCKMTQEFVAETLGISRQTVSKWETGASEPSTENLLALAKPYRVSVDELL